MNIFKIIFNGLKWISNILTLIINFILLSIVYFIGVGITSLIAKLFGKIFIKTKNKKSSYWIDLKLKTKNEDSYYRQF
jgi:hypothetical protein